MNTKILQPSESVYEYPLLIKRILTSSQRFEQTNGIVYRGDLRLSYQELNERICKLANVLTEMGVQAGDTVAVLDWDSHRYLECFFAVPMIGAILHTVNIRLSSDQILYTMNHAEDDVVLFHDDFTPIVEGIQDRLKTVKNYIALSDQETVPASNIPVSGEYENLLSAASNQYDFPDFDENSIATTFYTTGTTGNPKGVYFSHRQLVLHTLNMLGTLTTASDTPLLNSESVYMPITPMFHVHAWGIPYVATMIGAQQIYPGRYEPNTLAKLIREEGVTFSHCVPTVLQMVIQSQEAQKTDFDGWNIVIGGSPLTSGLAQKALELGVQCYTGYGMSETCPLLSLTRINRTIKNLNPTDQLAYRIKAGMPANLVDMQIWDANGNSLPHDDSSSGEIVVRAPWLTQGYLHEDEKGKELWTGSWLHTGDIGRISSEGYLTICDRIKDVIKTGGEWVSSLELESLISSYPQVDSVAVIGVPDDQWGERPHAIVVAKNSDLTAEMLRMYLIQFVDTGQINKWAIPATIDLVNEIPKTGVGKIDKKRIRDQYAIS